MFTIIKRSLLNRKKNIILIILTNLLGICLTTLIFFQYYISNYGEDLIRKNLSYGTENTYFMSYDYALNDEMQLKTIDEMKNIEGIGAVGTCSYEELSWSLKELYDIQKKYEGENDDEALNFFLTDSSGLKLSKIELSEGYIDEEEYDEFTMCVYLGSAYREKYSVNDEIVIPSKRLNDEGEIVPVDNKFIIRGFIKDGTGVIDTEALCNMEYYTYDYPVAGTTKSTIILQDNTYEGRGYIFGIEDTDRSEQILGEIRNLAKKNNVEVSFSSVEESFKDYRESTKRESEWLTDILGLILVTVIIITCCIQITTVIKRKSEYGILYADGFNDKNISFIIGIENLIIMGMTCVVSVIVTRYMLVYIFTTYEYQKVIVYKIFAENIAVCIVMMVMGIWLISTVTPVMLFKRMRTVDLIGGNDT